MIKPSIAILGCGWLGLPLAASLLKKGYAVHGATTTPAKLGVLQKAGITPFLLESKPPLTGNDIDHFFRTDILFLNIPFRRALKDPRLYEDQIRAVVEKVHGSAVKWVIFASSTSVYPGSLSDAKEDVPFTADNPRSQTLLNIERSLIEDKHFKTTIIRFAGLYGGAREIGRFMASKKGLTDGPVNLVHLDDCIGIITAVLKKKVEQAILNAVSDEHPLKSVLYARAAQGLGLPQPIFEEGLPRDSKIVRNDKVKEMLGYRFKHPDPLKDLSSL